MTEVQMAQAAAAAEKKLAHACNLTIVADSADFIHQPGYLERLAVETLGLDRHPQEVRYDLLAVPELASVADDPATLEVLATDLDTAIGLHGAETLLLVVRDGDGQKMAEALAAAHPSVTGKLGRIVGTSVKTPALSAKPELAVVGCMDWRLQGIGDFTALAKHALGLGKSTVATLTVPGVAKELTSDTTRRQVFLRWLEPLCQNGLKRLLLVSHEDCGKYGGHAGFDSHDSERQTLTDNLKTAAQAVAAALPGLEVSIGIAVIGHEVTDRIDLVE